MIDGPIIDDGELLTWIEEIGERIAELAERIGPDAEIVGCPGWRVDDLVGHVGPLWEGWYGPNLTLAHAEGAAGLPRIDPPTPVPEAFDQRIAYLRNASSAYVDTARTADLGLAIWAWDREVPARYWVERIATELAVHQWDLERIVGEVRRVTGARGALAVEEHNAGMLNMLIWAHDRFGGRFHHPPIPDEPIGIDVLDADVSWVLSADGIDTSLTRSSELPPTVVRGEGHDLMLHFYGRVPLAALDSTGDRTLLRQWNWWARDVYSPFDPSELSEGDDL